MLILEGKGCLCYSIKAVEVIVVAEVASGVSLQWPAMSLQQRQGKAGLIRSDPRSICRPGGD